MRSGIAYREKCFHTQDTHTECHATLISAAQKLGESARQHRCTNHQGPNLQKLVK